MSGIALKFTFLLVRTVAKPIATALKTQAKQHDIFKQSCIRIAQTLHSTDLKLRMSLLGEKRIKIRPLNDNKAIENGANFISEAFIFGVAGSLILYESYRSRKKSNDEKSALYDDLLILQDEIEYLKGKFGKLDVKTDDYKLPIGLSGNFIKLGGLEEEKVVERIDVKTLKDEVLKKELALKKDSASKKDLASKKGLALKKDLASKNEIILPKREVISPKNEAGKPVPT